MQLDEIAGRIQQVAEIRARAEQIVVSGPLPVHADASGPARSAAVDNHSDTTALLSLRRKIEAALQVVREDEQLAQGLLDRRSELKGRLTAYQAKAARLGLGEDQTCWRPAGSLPACCHGSRATSVR